MNDQTSTTTGTGTSDPYPVGWVRVEHVDAAVRASDDFSIFFVIALTFLGVAAAVAVALATAPKYPLPLYLIVAACGGVGAFSGALAKRERGNVRATRQNLKRETEYDYVPSPFRPFNFNVGTNQSPRVTTADSTGYRPEISQADQSKAEERRL